MLAVLGAGAWWWVTWPERTARDFCELLRSFKWAEAVAMCDGIVAVDLAKEEKENEAQLKGKMSNVRLEYDANETIRNRLLGRRKFQLMFDGRDRSATLTAARNRILVDPTAH